MPSPYFDQYRRAEAEAWATKTARVAAEWEAYARKLRERAERMAAEAGMSPDEVLALLCPCPG